MSLEPGPAGASPGKIERQLLASGFAEFCLFPVVGMGDDEANRTGPEGFGVLGTDRKADVVHGCGHFLTRELGFVSSVRDTPGDDLMRTLADVKLDTAFYAM